MRPRVACHVSLVHPLDPVARPPDPRGGHVSAPRVGARLPVQPAGGDQKVTGHKLT